MSVVTLNELRVLCGFPEKEEQDVAIKKSKNADVDDEEDEQHLIVAEKKKYPELLQKISNELRKAATLGATEAQLVSEPVKMWQDHFGCEIHEEAVARMFKAERGIPMPKDTKVFGSVVRVKKACYIFTLNFTDKKNYDHENLIEIDIGDEIDEHDTQEITTFFCGKLHNDIPFTNEGDMIWNWKK